MYVDGTLYMYMCIHVRTPYIDSNNSQVHVFINTCKYKCIPHVPQVVERDSYYLNIIQQVLLNIQNFVAKTKKE